MINKKGQSDILKLYFLVDGHTLPINIFFEI